MKEAHSPSPSFLLRAMISLHSLRHTGRLLEQGLRGESMLLLCDGEASRARAQTQRIRLPAVPMTGMYIRPLRQPAPS